MVATIRFWPGVGGGRGIYYRTEPQWTLQYSGHDQKPPLSELAMLSAAFRTFHGISVSLECQLGGNSLQLALRASI